MLYSAPPLSTSTSENLNTNPHFFYIKKKKNLPLTKMPFYPHTLILASPLTTLNRTRCLNILDHEADFRYKESVEPFVQPSTLVSMLGCEGSPMIIHIRPKVITQMSSITYIWIISLIYCSTITFLSNVKLLTHFTFATTYTHKRIHTS